MWYWWQEAQIRELVWSVECEAFMNSKVTSFIGPQTYWNVSAPGSGSGKR